MKTLHVLSIFVATLILVVPARAQALQLEWQSPVGSAPISGFAPLQPAEFLMDANGDDRPDLVIKDEANNQVVVVSGTDRSTQWTYPFPLGFEIDGKWHPIMAEIVGDGGLREVVVARRQGNRLIGVLEGGKVNAESGVVLFGQQYVLLGIDDYNGDGSLELYLGDTDARVVEVWGAGD